MEMKIATAVNEWIENLDMKKFLMAAVVIIIAIRFGTNIAGFLFVEARRTIVPNRVQAPVVETAPAHESPIEIGE